MSEDRHIRSDSIYVSWQARRGLSYSALKRGESVSADSLAEQIIMEWIAKHEPVILEHIKERDETEKQFKQTLRPKIPLG